MNAFDKIIGYQREKEELMQLCDILRNQDRYKALGAKLPRGLLIHGDPGLGKTLMARCFMEAVGWKSYTVRRNHPDGDFVRELSRVFKEAAETAPSIILLDDMDKFVTEEKSTEEYVAVQAAIDAVAGKDVYVIATANDLDPIPDSLLRAGRFDRKIDVTAPAGKDAENIIRFYLENKNLGQSVNFADVAKMLTGSSCAELGTMLNEAAICAGYGHSKQIEMDHLVEVILRDEYGAGDDRNTQDSSTRWRIAYHEAGHAAMQELLCEGGVGLVSIRPQQSGVGGFMRACAQSPAGCADILISLAGTAATELRYRAFVYLCVVTGARRGEIAALKWDKVNMNTGQIDIGRNLLYSSKLGIYENSTKSREKRLLKIPQEVIDILKQLRREQTETRLKVGEYWTDTGYIFTRDNGQHMNPQTWTGWMDDFSRRYQLPHINPHAFRHTAASVLIAKAYRYCDS